MTRSPFPGRWRITWMSGWDQEYVDMVVPGHITFANGRAGSFQFGLLQAQMDCSVRAGSKPPRVDFTWHGFDEGTELTGRGYAEIVDGKLNGHLYIHFGDDSAFQAIRQSVTARKSKST